MASMVTLRASVVAAMASMASMVVPLEWRNLMVAEPNRGDERVDGLTHKIREERADGFTLHIEGSLTVALILASVVAAWMALVAPLMASMASMVAGFVDGFVGFDGFDGGVVGMAEADDRVEQR